MTYIATITSKRQLTIPVDLFKKIGFSKGDKVIIEEKAGNLYIKSATDLVNKLAGSVSITKSQRKIDVDQAIKIAKKTHFGLKVI